VREDVKIGSAIIRERRVAKTRARDFSRLWVPLATDYDPRSSLRLFGGDRAARVRLAPRDPREADDYERARIFARRTPERTALLELARDIHLAHGTPPKVPSRVGRGACFAELVLLKAYAFVEAGLSGPPLSPDVHMRAR